MIKQILTAAFALVGATTSVAQGYTPQTVPNVQLMDARRYTSNPDGVLATSTVASIDSMCLDLRNRGIAQVVVLALGSVDENSLDMFAHKVLNLWGVGDKAKDNGMVISVVRDQRDIQFETGYGLEGVLPDAICKRIQTLYMAPELRAGNWDAGVLAGVRAVYNILIENEAELGSPRAPETSPKAIRSFGRMFIGLLVLVALLIILGGRGGRRNRGGRNRGDGFGDGDSRSFEGPDPGALIGGILGGMLGGGFGRGGGGFGGGGFGGGGFGGGGSGGGGSRTGF